MRRRAEAVDPQTPRVAGQLQRTVADQARAQQRCRLGVAVSGGDGEAVALVGQHVLGVAAVEGIAGEARPVAEVLPADEAEAAGAAGAAEPRHPDAVALAEAIRPFPFPLHDADDLVARHQGQLRVGQFTVHDVKVGPADPAGTHANQYLPGLGVGLRQFYLAEASLGGPKNHRTHWNCSSIRRLPNGPELRHHPA